MDKEIIENSVEELVGKTKDSISRRDALKRMAKIAIGVGAAAVLPAALSNCEYHDYYDYYDYYGNYYSNYYYYSDYYYYYYGNYYYYY